MQPYPASDEVVRDILKKTRRIALVGASANPARPSHQVMAFLLAKGYEVDPVNPGLAGQDLLGRRVYSRLGDIPQGVDMVDCFRAADAIPALTDEAIGARAKSLWLQLGLYDTAAARKAEAAGLRVVMNRCPKIEFARLGLAAP